MALAVALGFVGCSKAQIEVRLPADAAPPPPPACTATLHAIPIPPDWRTYVIAGTSGASVEVARDDGLGETTHTSDVVVGDFVVRSTFGKMPVPAGPLVVRQQGCTGAEISANPYWNGGAITLRKSASTHVLSWRAGGAAVDEALVAFRRD